MSKSNIDNKIDAIHKVLQSYECRLDAYDMGIKDIKKQLDCLNKSAMKEKAAFIATMLSASFVALSMIIFLLAKYLSGK